MSDRPETRAEAGSQVAVTELERERLDWQRRLYAAEDIASRLLREKGEMERTLRGQIAELETEIRRLRDRIDESKMQYPGRQPRPGDVPRGGEAQHDPFGHLIRQASKGKHARLRRRLREHTPLLLLVGLALALSAVLGWEGYRTRLFWKSNPRKGPAASVPQTANDSQAKTGDAQTTSADDQPATDPTEDGTEAGAPKESAPESATDMPPTIDSGAGAADAEAGAADAFEGDDKPAPDAGGSSDAG